MKISYIWSKTFKKLRGSALSSSVIHPTSKVESGSQLVNSTMGKHSFCGYDCDINHTEIGSFCSIANNVIIGGGAHPLNWISSSPVFYRGRDSVKTKFSEHERDPQQEVLIGHDVWIGQNALVKQGVVIGVGSVIGMGSVVTKDVAPYAIVAGNPAKEIKFRFDREMRSELLASKWWSESDDVLLELGFYSNNLKEFLKKLSAHRRNTT